jgi:DNA oxidative demethylase
MADGAMLLRGSALPFETDILSALQAIIDQAPFRHMTTPGLRAFLPRASCAVV